MQSLTRPQKTAEALIQKLLLAWCRGQRGQQQLERLWLQQVGSQMLT